MNAITLRIVRTAGGMTRHVPCLAPPPAKKGKKKPYVPDPIKTNGESGAEELRLLVERAERIEQEIKGMQDDLKDVFAEGTARGYDKKAIKRVMAVRKKRREDHLEEEAIFETYAQSLGML
ncbi:MAG: DUF2312 domain-containing protein [Sphingomonas parapaucimobilis]